MNNFDTIFNNFIKLRFSRAEVIADILGNQPNKPLNADYFFENRTIIGELKCLEVEAYPKLNDLVKELLESGEMPLFYGELPLNKVLEKCIEKDKIQNKAMEKIVSSLETNFRKANQQIRETRKFFNLPSAKGLVIIVNTGNTVLMPDMAVYFLRKLLNKSQNGNLIYAEIDYVIFTSDRHVFELNGMKEIPLISIVKQNTIESERFLEDFRRHWVSFRQSYISGPLEEATQENLSKFNKVI